MENLPLPQIGQGNKKDKKKKNRLIICRNDRTRLEVEETSFQNIKRQYGQTKASRQ